MKAERDDFKLTVWQSGASMSAMIECPAFVDSRNDLIEVADALLWAQQRISQIDPMEDADRCGRIMIGSGEDSWDPTCDLAEGHSGSCKSYDAADQHRLVRDESQSGDFR